MVGLVWSGLVVNGVRGDLVSVNSREVTRALVESMAELTDTMLYREVSTQIVWGNGKSGGTNGPMKVGGSAGKRAPIPKDRRPTPPEGRGGRCD